MKFLSKIIIFLFAITNTLYAQERFFTFVEGWTTIAPVEYDDKYIVVGTGLNNSNLNNIQFNELSKTGELIESWQINISGTVVSDIGTQQCLSDLKFGKRIMGLTIITNDNIVKSKRLIFNDDFSEIVDSMWTYQPPQEEQSDMFATCYQDPNKILHGVHYSDNNTVNSTLVSTDTLGNVIWESNFSCGGTYCWMEPRHIHAAHDGGYIFTNNERRGFAEGGIVGELDIGTIIKTDSLGVQEWRIRPGGVGEPYTSPHILLQPTDDGNYLCAWADNRVRTSDGTTFDHYNTNPNATIWFAKINSNGHKIWEKNIAEEIELWGTEEVVYLMDQMIRLPDDNFALTSYDQIIKINQNAEVIWARRVRPPELINTPNQYSEFYIKGVSVTSDGGFICTGELQINPGDVYPEYIQTGFVLKLDEYGCLEEGCQEDDPIVSVETPEVSEGKLLIYPNPADEYLIVEYAIIESSEASLLTITNINGQVVHQEELNYPQDELVIITNKLPAGQYFCTLSNAIKTVKTEKFILAK